MEKYIHGEKVMMESWAMVIRMVTTFPSLLKLFRVKKSLTLRAVEPTQLPSLLTEKFTPGEKDDMVV